MALEWFDGFNSQDASEIDISYDNGGLSLDSSGLEGSFPTDTGSDAGYLRVAGVGTQFVEKVVSATQTKWIGFRLRNQSTWANTNSIICVVKHGATQHLLLDMMGSGSNFVLRLRNGDGTVLATGTTQFTNGTTWRYVELRVKIDDTVGEYELLVDDVAEFSGTNADTRNGGSALVDRIRLSTSVATGIHFDDFYIDDSEFHGKTFRAHSLHPTGAGDSTQFTPSASTNHSNVDEPGLFDGDTTYNSSSTIGHKDSFTCDALPGSPTKQILGVQARVIAREAGANAVLQAHVRSNGTANSGSSAALTTAYSMVMSNLALTNPDGGSAWTEAAVNAAQVECEVMAGTTNTVRVTKAFLEVAYKTATAVASVQPVAMICT